MSNYAVFFDKNNITFRLPVNPEEIEVSTAQAIEKYEVLKLGQIAVPSHMELREYSFEVELPNEALHYVETPNEFLNAEGYLNILKAWRSQLEPVRFLAGTATGKYTVANNAINTLVLIESMNITEKAGEEQDKYVSFKLLEYRNYSKWEYILEVDETTGKTKKTKSEEKNPKSTGYYVVQAGDTLWSIAKKYYGNGASYTKILNANKDKIKSPAIIYAGQRLVIPA